MDAIDYLIKCVSDAAPKFNDHVLRGFTRENIDGAHSFPAVVIKEGLKLIDADTEFCGYRFMLPEETVRFELVGAEDRSKTAKNRGVKIPLTVSHHRLVEYKVRFKNSFFFSRIYVPYMHEDMIQLNDKKQVIKKIILEQTIARVIDKDKDGVSVSPLRTNLLFNRKQTFSVLSYVTGIPYSHFIVTSRLYHGTIRQKICDTTIVHYLLARFGFLATIKKFGLTTSDISFSSTVDDDVDDYEYFSAISEKTLGTEKPDLFVKIKRVLLGDKQIYKFVINLLFILHKVSPYKRPSIDTVYLEDGWLWKIMLGIIIMDDKSDMKAYSNAEANLRSVDYFIDPLTQHRLETFGVPVNDIYDLLIYIFKNIDSYMVKTKTQDIYQTRIDITSTILVEVYAKRMFNKGFYNLTNRANITEKDIAGVLRFNASMFRITGSGKRDNSEHYMAPPSIVGDNFLFSGGLEKIRLGGKPDQRLHPSMVVVESIDAIVGKTINRTGFINPFVPTDQNGAFLKPDYAADIDSIAPFIPK